MCRSNSFASIGKQQRVSRFFEMMLLGID